MNNRFYARVPAGLVACDDGLHYILLDETSAHCNWVMRSHPNGGLVSVRKATEHELAHAKARRHLRDGVGQIESVRMKMVDLNNFTVLAQRLREYNHNPHHINPTSEAFHKLIDDAANALAAQRDEGLAREAELQKQVERLRVDAADVNWMVEQRDALQQRLAEAEKLAAQRQIMLRDASEHRKRVRADYEKAIELLKEVRDTGGELSKAWFKKLSEFLASPGCADGEKAE